MLIRGNFDGLSIYIYLEHAVPGAEGVGVVALLDVAVPEDHAGGVLALQHLHRVPAQDPRGAEVLVLLVVELLHDQQLVRVVLLTGKITAAVIR